MAENVDHEARRRRRLVARADQMATSGRLTDEEAERLRSASGPVAVDGVIRSIRLRHAGPRLGAAVDDGSMSRVEADNILQRLTNGEHSKALVAKVRKLRTR